LLTIVGGAPVFTGKGVSAVVRTAGGAAAGDFTFTLDPGVPGNAGEVAAGAPDIRSLVTVRGSATATIAGGSSITATGITYTTPSATDGGDTQFRLVLTNATPAGVDPSGANASGVEIALFRGF
jgi:hypothetical protein